jgi:hypothetical protein
VNLKNRFGFLVSFSRARVILCVYTVVDRKPHTWCCKIIEERAYYKEDLCVSAIADAAEAEKERSLLAKSDRKNVLAQKGGDFNRCHMLTSAEPSGVLHLVEIL